MTHHSGLGHTGGDLSSSDILATLYLGEFERQSRRTGLAATRSLHYEQGPLFRRLLFNPCFQGIFPACHARYLHGLAFNAQWTSGSEQTSRRRSQHWPSRPWITSRCRLCSGGAYAWGSVACLCFDGGRRIAGGLKLGGCSDRPAVFSRQPCGDRRPQSNPAGRLYRQIIRMDPMAPNGQPLASLLRSWTATTTLRC